MSPLAEVVSFVYKQCGGNPSRLHTLVTSSIPRKGNCVLSNYMKRFSCYVISYLFIDIVVAYVVS